MAVALAVFGLATLAGRLRRFAVAERSMSPALEPGDYLVSVRSRRSPLVGDMVIYPARDDPALFLVKRVIATGDSRVRLDLGIVTVDGNSPAEPWAHGAGGDGLWQVGPDEVFVLGDDRSHSALDSADIGPLPVGAVDSIVRFRYWPPGRIGRL